MSGTVLQSGAGIKAISLCTIFTKTFPSWTLSEKLMNFVVCLSLVPPMVEMIAVVPELHFPMKLTNARWSTSLCSLTSRPFEL